MRKSGIAAISLCAQTVVCERAFKSALAAPAPRTRIDRDARAPRGKGHASPTADSTARTMLQTYDWKGALESCREVLKQDPDHLGALEVSAQAQWYEGQFEEVVRTTNRLLKLNPLEPGYRYTRGMALMSMGHLSRATDDFRQAIAQSENPGFLQQVQNSLLAIEGFQRGGPDRLAALNAMRVARRSQEFGTLTNELVH